MSTNALRRLIDLPGVRALENKLVMERVSRNQHLDGFRNACEDVSFDLFGITRGDVFEEFGKAYLRDHPEKDVVELDLDDLQEAYKATYKTESLGWEEDKVEFLKSLGWDLTNDRGTALSITDYFCRQVEAVATGRAGALPDLETASAESWGEGLEHAARAFKRRPK